MKGKTTDVKEKVAEKVEPSVEEKAEREVAKAEVEAKKLWVGLNWGMNSGNDVNSCCYEYILSDIYS